MKRSWMTGLAVLALGACSLVARAESPAPTAASPPPALPTAPASPPEQAAPMPPPTGSPYYSTPYGWPYVAPYPNPYATPYVAGPGQPPGAYAAPAPKQTVEFPRARGSIATRWWFWAALGAAAVGIVVAGIALAPREPYSGNASPGIVTAF